MGVGMHKTSSSKSEHAAWQEDEAAVDVSAGATVTITVPGKFRLMRIAIRFSAGVAPTITIDRDNRESGSNWDQNIRTVTLPAGSTDYTFIGGQGYEYPSGDSIAVTISAVAAIAYVSWSMEQL